MSKDSIRIASNLVFWSGLWQAASFGVDRPGTVLFFSEGEKHASAECFKILKIWTRLFPIFCDDPNTGEEKFSYSQRNVMVMKRDIEILGELGQMDLFLEFWITKGVVNVGCLCESLMPIGRRKPCTFPIVSIWCNLRIWSMQLDTNH